MKGILIADLLIAAAVAADQYCNYGYYTDGVSDAAPNASFVWTLIQLHSVTAS
jgi:hypothetical protein